MHAQEQSYEKISQLLSMLRHTNRITTEIKY